MAPTSTRFFALLAPLALIGCFNSDERAGHDGNASVGAGSETYAVYDDDTNGESDDSWTPEETGSGETTCRDAITCLVMCQFAQIINMDPEPDLSCFLECDMGLSVEEAYLLIKLAECIGTQCAEIGECGPESTNNECLICIAAYGQDPEPPGCQAEALACQ